MQTKEQNKYLKKELGTLNLTEFEENLRTAAVHVFSANAAITETDRHMISYMMGSGTYGNLGNSVNNKLKKIELFSGDKKRSYKYVKRIWDSGYLHILHGISMQWIRKKSIVIIMIIWMINRKVYGRIMANICPSTAGVKSRMYY